MTEAQNTRDMNEGSRSSQNPLPWRNDELEASLRELIGHGTEFSKVDFKREVEFGTSDQKAELLKDITALANTYDDHNLHDHGLLVYGVAGKSILGTSNTETDADHLQAQVDDLLNKYISPMPAVHVVGFRTDDGRSWGVVIVPPRHRKPYMFFKEIQCQDRTRSRRRGDWFVRRGTTTDRGLPEDFSRIVQEQTALLARPLEEPSLSAPLQD